MNPTHTGACFCGAVQFEVSGQPEAMGYCHCQSCRTWSASPVNAFSLWKTDAVRITKGTIAIFEKTPFSQRKYCPACGGHIMAVHPSLGLIDVYAAVLPSLRFFPVLHVNYAQTVLPMKDGLPKLKDFPIPFGGTGETMPE